MNYRNIILSIFIIFSLSGTSVSLAMQLTKTVDIKVKNEYGITQLHHAVSSGDINKIKSLIEAGADVNAKDMFGNTVLRYAALSSNPKILNFLLKNTDIKKDINVKDGLGGTLLFDVCAKGNYENAKILIENGADVNAQGEHMHPSKDVNGAQLELRYSSWIKMPSIDYFTIDGWSTEQVHDGNSPLHVASHKGYADIVDLLIEHGADVNIKDKNYMTPLHAAAGYGHVTIIEKLLKAGANPEAETIETDLNCSIPEATGKMYTFGESRYTAKGITPIFSAILGGKTEVVKKLAPLVNINHTVGSFKATSLHLASLLGYFDIAKVLAEDERINPGLLLREKHTAADIADSYGKKNIADFLIEKMDYLRQQFTISLSKDKREKAPTKIINNDVALIKSSLKTNIRADLPLIEASLDKPTFKFSCFLDNDCVLPGVYYRKNGAIEPILKKLKVSNHLSCLNYSGCSKKNDVNDVTHNFCEAIEKENGHLGRVVIDITDPNTVTDNKKKFDLFVTIPGKMDKVQNKNGQQKVLHSEQGVFEFKVRKTLYNEQGKCYHRFFNSKGILGAQGFGADYRKKEEKKRLNNF